MEQKDQLPRSFAETAQKRQPGGWEGGIHTRLFFDFIFLRLKGESSSPLPPSLPFPPPPPPSLLEDLFYFPLLPPKLATSCEWLFCFRTERRASPLALSSDSKCHLAAAFSGTGGAACTPTCLLPLRAGSSRDRERRGRGGSFGGGEGTAPRSERGCEQGERGVGDPWIWPGWPTGEIR